MSKHESDDDDEAMAVAADIEQKGVRRVKPKARGGRGGNGATKKKTGKDARGAMTKARGRRNGTEKKTPEKTKEAEEGGEDEGACEDG